MNKYFIYLRVSSEKQDTGMQKDMALEWLKHHERGKEFSHVWYIDEDVSTQLPIEKRPALHKLLGDLHKGIKVWVYNSDRLARKVIETFTIYDKILKAGATLISSTEPALSDPLFLAVAAGYAQKTHDHIRSRVRDGLKSKKIRNERYSRWIPYGWKMDMSVQIELKNDKGEMEWKHGRLIPEPEEMKLIDKVKEMSLMGLSYGQMAKVVAELGFRNREGNLFHKMAIHKIAKRLSQCPEECVL